MPAAKPRNGSVPMTMDRLRSTKKARTKSIYIPNNEELADRFEELQEKLEELRTRHRMMPDFEPAVKALTEAEDEFEKLQKELRKDGNSLKFTFRSLGPKGYDKLVNAHPVPEEKQKEYEEKGMQVPYDVDTFTPAIIAKCCVEPELTYDFVVEDIMDGDDWSMADVKQLFSAALEVNIHVRNIDLGKEFRRTISSGKS